MWLWSRRVRAYAYELVLHPWLYTYVSVRVPSGSVPGWRCWCDGARSAKLETERKTKRETPSAKRDAKRETRNSKCQTKRETRNAKLQVPNETRNAKRETLPFSAKLQVPNENAKRETLPFSATVNRTHWQTFLKIYPFGPPQCRQFQVLI